MAKKSLRRTLLACLLTAVVAGSTVAFPMLTASATSSAELQGEINELEAQQSQLEAQQQEVANRLASLKEDKQRQLDYKKTLDDQMVSIQSEIDVINKKIKKLDTRIKELQAEIADDEENIVGIFTQLKSRIHALYLAGEASDLELLLNAKSLPDLADKIQVMKSITAHDTELIDNLKEQLNKIKAQKAEIEANREEVSKAKNKLEAKKAEVTALVEESNAVIAQITASEGEASALAAELEAEFNAQSDELERIYQEYYNAKSAEEKEEIKRKQQQVKPRDDPGYDPGYTPTPPSSGGNSNASGQFIWPAPGTTIITSGVGPRWGTRHNGIDISGGGCYGSPIVASDAGTVIVAVHSGWGGGYGLHVMIDHGNGYTTVYGHASNVIVEQGQHVNQGQTIAYIGSTGDSTGPHLHFEIRQNGAYMDPESYVGA